MIIRLIGMTGASTSLNTRVLWVPSPPQVIPTNVSILQVLHGVGGWVGGWVGGLLVSLLIAETKVPLLGSI